MVHRIRKESDTIRRLNTHAHTIDLLKDTDEFSKRGPIGILPGNTDSCVLLNLAQNLKRKTGRYMVRAIVC